MNENLGQSLITNGLGDGKGKRPYSLSVPEEENKDKLQEMEEAKMKIEANLSNYITEISKLYSVNKQEAEKILAENIRVNSDIFEKSKHMSLEDNDSDSEKKETKN